MPEPARPRWLRPAALVATGDLLWAVDAVQPVAAVLRLPGGVLERVVSWPRVPPPPNLTIGRTVLGEGQSLWCQEQSGGWSVESGPLVRVGLDGLEVAAWTGGLPLRACSAGAAWCAEWPRQELAHADEPRSSPARQGRLLRVGAGGAVVSVETEGLVRDVRDGPDGLHVDVDTGEARVRSLSAGPEEIGPGERVRAVQPLLLRWDDPLPDRLTAAQHGTGPTFWPPDWRDAAMRPSAWLSRPGEPIASGSVRWTVGWADAPRTHTSARPLTALARTGDGETRRHSVGAGWVAASMAVPDGAIAVAISRPGSLVVHPPSPVEVVLVEPTSGSRVLLPGDSVDITGHCWPLVAQPEEADSYVAQQVSSSALDRYWQHEDVSVRSLARGMTAVATRADGSWPETLLEWSFAHPARPGLRLRRRVPLFDELGRIEEPEYPDINLTEDLATGNVPPAELARDGVLDV